MDYIANYDSPLGEITLASDGTSLVGLWFDGQKFFADTLDSSYSKGCLSIFDETRRWLDVFFSGREPDFTPALNMRTTFFRKEVWEIMQGIPYGRTTTYGAIALTLAERRNYQRFSARAVGCAVGRNAISLIIPCHRVIGADGSLVGYAGGVDRKRKLLELEGVELSAFEDC